MSEICCPGGHGNISRERGGGEGGFSRFNKSLSKEGVTTCPGDILKCVLGGGGFIVICTGVWLNNMECVPQ